MIKNREKMAENFLVYQTKIILAFLEPLFVSFWLISTVTVNFFLFVLICLRFNCFMLQSQKIKRFVLSRCPHSDPRYTIFTGIKIDPDRYAL